MNHTAETPRAESAEHAPLFKSPRQLIIAVVLAFIIPVVVILLLVNLVMSGNQAGAGSSALEPEAIASRIKPVASFTLVDASAPKELKTGQQVYDATCSACHGAGVAGAPKFGDATAWAPLIQAGLADMLKIALEGKGAMPAKGGNAALSDFEIERAVVYMANQSGGSFPEPTEGGSGAAAEAAPADNIPAAAPEAATETAPAAAPDTPATEAPAAAVPDAPSADSPPAPTLPDNASSPDTTSPPTDSVTGQPGS